MSHSSASALLGWVGVGRARVRRRAAATALAALLALGASAAGAQEHKPAQGGGHDHSGEAAALPKDLPGTWAAIRAEQAAIAASAAHGALGEIHPKTERLAELARGLAGYSADLAPEKRARVDGATKQLGQLAGSLHTAADGGDAAAVKRDLDRLGSLLRLIEAQYPPAALKPAQSGAAPAPATPDVAAAPPAHDHSAHDHGAAPAAGAAHDHAAPGHAHSHGSRPAGAVDAAPRAKLDVSAEGMRFTPQLLRVTAGVPTQISLRNVDGLDHALVVKTPDGKQDWVHLHALAGADDAATYQLDAPGRYPINCTIPGHTEAGMTAELVVEARVQSE